MKKEVSQASAGDDFGERPDEETAEAVRVCFIRGEGFPENGEKLRRMRGQSGLDAVGDELHALFQLQGFQRRLQSFAKSRQRKRRMHPLHRLRDEPCFLIRKRVLEGLHVGASKEPSARFLQPDRRNFKRHTYRAAMAVDRGRVAG